MTDELTAAKTAALSALNDQESKENEKPSPAYQPDFTIYKPTKDFNRASIIKWMNDPTNTAIIQLNMFMNKQGSSKPKVKLFMSGSNAFHCQATCQLRE